MRRPEHRALLIRIFAAPAMLAALTAYGLAAGVLGDGIWDVTASISLGVPVVLLVWHTLYR